MIKAIERENRDRKRGERQRAKKQRRKRAEAVGGCVAAGLPLASNNDYAVRGGRLPANEPGHAHQVLPLR
jgi:hypothetical protein